MKVNVPGAGAGRGNGWRMVGWGVAGLLWLLPLAAMQVTDEVNWTAGDFVFAAVLIGGFGLVAELAVRRSSNRACRAAAVLLAAAVFLLVWINAAVGIIGDEGNRLDLLYTAVLAVVLIGGALARFRPRGMARATGAAGIVQALIGTVAVVAGADEPPGAFGIAVLNAGFVALFAGSAWLFAWSAGDRGLPNATGGA